MRPLALAVLAVLAVLAAAAPASAQGQRTAAWVARMDGLAATLTSLLAEASAGPLDDERRARLRRDTATLRQLAHGLQKMDALPDSDPTIPWLLSELTVAIDDVSRADAGRVEDAVFTVAWTCMGCHTRTGLGTPRPIADLAPLPPGLPADVRGTALAATRRFQDARRAFRDAAADEQLARTEPLRWERAVRGALMLDLRVHHDPRSALAVAEQVLDMPDGDALYADAAAWRLALAPMVKSPRPTPRTAAELEAEAARWIAEAELRGQMDAGREIFFLRASAAAHELLMQDPPPSLKVQALAWLGQSYRELRDLDIWSLHLVYDAACVEAAPHSLLAGECYRRWLDGARAAFTGNAGGALPPELAARERALRALAAPKPPR